jgi:P27 family predicted phage terminase small subunit
MGRRGPAPTPTANLKARGSWRGKANPNEPQPAQGAPDRPSGLADVAGDIWDALVGTVAPGVLTRDNGQTLARYCHGLSRWWKLAEWLDGNDDTYETEDKLGNVRHVRHPNVITYEKLSRDLTRLEQEFGLTPSSRTRVAAVLNPPKEKPKPAGAPVMKIAN